MNDLIILAMLLEGPQHGYRLKRDAGAVFGQGTLHNNLVYPLLRRFTAEGWVTKQTVPGERGQKRQQYAITPLGRRMLLERLSSFTEQDARSEESFRGRVGFFELLPAEARERILGLREGFLQGRDERLAALQKNMDLGVYGGEVVIFLRAQVKIELAWIGRLRRLRSKDLSSKEARKRS
jgi:DNA-binding PadR family transcriptional regulator